MEHHKDTAERLKRREKSHLNLSIRAIVCPFMFMTRYKWKSNEVAVQVTSTELLKILLLKKDKYLYQGYTDFIGLLLRKNGSIF